MKLEEYYQQFNEDLRLLSNVGRVEFETTIRLIDRYLQEGYRILDIGAGFGSYSLYYARQGFTVEALDMMEHHVEGLQRKASQENIKLQVHVENALDLSRYEEDSFDVVLCLGPLYHLHGAAKKKALYSGG